MWTQSRIPQHSGGCNHLAAALVLLGMMMASEAGRAGEDAQYELRWQQELARREIEDRAAAQAEALRGQEEAIRRLEATRARIEANAPQVFQPAVEPVPIYSLPAGAPASPPPVQQEDVVGGMRFAPLTEQLGSYFGTKSGVLVVRAGDKAPFGLRDGDVILAIDGRVPVDEQHVATILRSYRSGERATLRIQRNRQPIEITAVAPGPRGN